MATVSLKTTIITATITITAATHSVEMPIKQIFYLHPAVLTLQRAV